MRLWKEKGLSSCYPLFLGSKNCDTDALLLIYGRILKIATRMTSYI